MNGPPNTSQTASGGTSIRTLQTASQTQTQTETQPANSRPILILRGDHAETRHIQWAEDVIDNEGMGKKSSKVCCIYHKPHAPGESSDESSSSDESDSDSEPDNTKARPTASSGKGKAKRGRKKHHHKDDDNSGNGEGPSRRRPSPNAYERMPKYGKKVGVSNPDGAQ